MFKIFFNYVHDLLTVSVDFDQECLQILSDGVY